MTNILIEFDKQGTNWNDKIMPKDIFDRTFDIAHFLNNHSSPVFDHIKPIVFGKYRVVMRFTDSGHNNGSIWCNGRWLVCRTKKQYPIKLNKGVTLIAGTPLSSGGSNSYPCPSFKEGCCVIEFTSHGLPMTNWLNGWKSELISIEPLNKTT